jgi:hypothetical protein
MLVTASLTVSGVSAVIWVLDDALVVVFRVVAAVFIAIVGGDMAAEQRGSGLKREGWGVCWGTVNWLGNVCHRLQGAGGRFGAGGKVVVVVVDDVGVVDGDCAGVVSGDVVVVDDVGVIDGGCAGVVSGDVVVGSDNEGVVGVFSRGIVCVTASAVIVIVWVVEFVLMRVVGSVCRAVH